MLERYTRPEMGKIWSLENKYAAWLKVEIAATNAWAELGEVPEADAKKIADNASLLLSVFQNLKPLPTMMWLLLLEQFLKAWVRRRSGFTSA